MCIDWVIVVINMARQADRLIKIGLEGFAAIDESFGRAKRPPVLKIPNPHPPSQIPVTKVIDSDEAAQLYGGRGYINYRKGKPVPF